MPAEVLRDAKVSLICTGIYPWSDHARAAPLGDITALQLAALPEGDVDCRGRAFMGQAAFDSLRNNLNPQDLFGRRTTARYPHAITAVNGILTGDDLPLITIDETVPAGTVLFIGRRRGGGGEYRAILRV